MHSAGPTVTQLLHRAPAGGPDARGVIHAIDAADAGWHYVGFEAHRLGPGDGLTRPAVESEVAVVAIEGRVMVSAGGRALGPLGVREDVFSGPPAELALLPPGTVLEVDAETASTLVLAQAPAGEGSVERVIRAPDIVVEQRGSGSTARRIHHLLPPGGQAGRLILFEVFTPGGNWSSYPPHKHDTEDPPRESYLEELYYHRFARASGWAFQRVYTSDRSLDEAYAVADHDVVLVPRGYHPVGSPAGYDGYYLNVMAGPTRAWHFTLDPDHAWLMDWDPTAPR